MEYHHPILSMLWVHVGRYIRRRNKKIDEMEVTSNSPILGVILFSRSTGGDKSLKSGGQEVFIGSGRLCTTVYSMEVR